MFLANMKHKQGGANLGGHLKGRFNLCLSMEGSSGGKPRGKAQQGKWP